MINQTINYILLQLKLKVRNQFLKICMPHLDVFFFIEKTKLLLTLEKLLPTIWNILYCYISYLYWKFPLMYALLQATTLARDRIFLKRI